MNDGQAHEPGPFFPDYRRPGAKPDTRPFAGIRNKLRLLEQYAALTRIIDRAGDILRTAREGREELTEIVSRTTFMLGALHVLIHEAGPSDLSGGDVANVIQQAETLSDIVGCALG